MTSAPADQLHLEEFQGFTCTSCGLCCTRPWGVPIEPEVEAGIRASKLFAQREKEGYVPLEVSAVGGTLRATRQRNGDCMFLAADTLCGLHTELGGSRKPVGCQLYPYRAVRTPSGTFFSQSWVCPPVVAGTDRNARQNLEELAAVLKLYPDAAVQLPETDRPVPLLTEVPISWASYLQLETRLLEAYDLGAPLDSLLGMAIGLTGLATTSGEGIEQWPALAPPPEDMSFERELLTIYLAAMISIVEHEHDLGLRDGVRQALLAGERVESAFVGTTLPVLDLDVAQPLRIREAYQRYFRNAVKGKNLLVPSVIRQLLSMAIGHAMLLFYAEAFRAKRGEAELSLEALTLAFEIVDGELSHNQALDPFFIDFENTLVKLAS